MNDDDAKQRLGIRGGSVIRQVTPSPLSNADHLPIAAGRHHAKTYWLKLQYYGFPPPMDSRGQGFRRGKAVSLGSPAAVVGADLDWDRLRGCFTLIAGAGLGDSNRAGRGHSSGAPEHLRGPLFRLCRLPSTESSGELACMLRAPKGHVPGENPR